MFHRFKSSRELETVFLSRRLPRAYLILLENLLHIVPSSRPSCDRVITAIREGKVISNLVYPQLSPQVVRTLTSIIPYSSTRSHPLLEAVVLHPPRLPPWSQLSTAARLLPCPRYPRFPIDLPKRLYTTMPMAMLVFPNSVPLLRLMTRNLPHIRHQKIQQPHGRGMTKKLRCWAPTLRTRWGLRTAGGRAR